MHTYMHTHLLREGQAHATRHLCSERVPICRRRSRPTLAKHQCHRLCSGGGGHWGGGQSQPAMVSGIAIHIHPHTACVCVWPNSCLLNSNFVEIHVCCNSDVAEFAFQNSFIFKHTSSAFVPSCGCAMQRQSLGCCCPALFCSGAWLQLKPSAAQPKQALQVGRAEQILETWGHEAYTNRT